MIKFHPNKQLLVLHSNGELPLSMSLAISAHLELCTQCQQAFTKMIQQSTEAAFSADVEMSHDDTQQNDLLDNMLSSMLGSELFESDTPTHRTVIKKEATKVTIKGKEYTLPRAFRQQINADWQGIGKVSRLRINTGEEQARASLLHIEPHGEIPEHTHKGSELTLLLAGEFSDEYSQYKPGDFMLLDGQHQHSPRTQEGCLCFTIVDAPLYFTKGISKLLNPIGELLY